MEPRNNQYECASPLCVVMRVFQTTALQVPRNLNPVDENAGMRASLDMR